MSVRASPAGRASAAARARKRLRATDRIGERTLHGLCVGAAVLAALALFGVAEQVISGASPAISHFGLSFLWHTVWKPPFDRFGAAVFLYGTLVTSFMALILAAPIGISIGLFLSMLAPRGVRGVAGPLVEMLAAIPSVILGLWGIIVLAPFVQSIEPWLHSTLGFIPLFGPPQTTGASIFTAGLVLTIMVIPIIAALTRDLFLTVPRDLTDAAAALGATRWETIRGVVLPGTSSGVIAACVLGLGRALGEAIAVTQVIGSGNAIHSSLFDTGDTFASRIVSQIQSIVSPLHQASLFYLALILLVIGLAANLTAQWIARRFSYEHTLGR